MKVTTKTYALLAAAALTAVGCTKKYYYDENGLTPIRLSSSVMMSNQPRLQEVQIVDGQSLSFFVTGNGSTSEVLYANQIITANGTGGFSYENPMYYPASDENVDFYAIHPYMENANLGSTLDFTINANQAVQANYLYSDLLFSNVDNVERSVNPITMTFSHKLSRIDFEIVPSDGFDLTALNSIQVLGLAPTVGMSTTTGNLSTPSGTATAVTAYGTRGILESETSVKGISAIVVPQQFQAGAGVPMIRIQVGNTVYEYVPADNYTFISGAKHTFILTINGAGIELESTITDWTDGGSVTGDGNPA